MRHLSFMVIFIGIALAIFFTLASAWREARRSAIASASQCPLNQLQMALRLYEDEHGCLPPAYIADPDGNPMHSWRVLVLPYIEEPTLYNAYDFTEPWNGPNNRKLADKMPDIFQCPSEPKSNSHTNYVVIVGPDTAFPGSRSTSLDDFHDGLDNTILLVEIADSDIVWTEPRDLHVDTMSFRVNDDDAPSISSSRRVGPYVVFADYIHTRRISPFLHPTALRALTTIAGREEVCMANVQDVGLVSLCTGTATDADLDRFDRWPDVRDIWLNRCKITDTGLAHLNKPRHMNKVHLARTALTDEGLRHLKGRSYLYELNLSHTEVTDRGLRHLKGLTDMPYLNLTNTKVTDNGVKQLKEALPKVEITR